MLLCIVPAVEPYVIYLRHLCRGDDQVWYAAPISSPTKSPCSHTVSRWGEQLAEGCCEAPQFCPTPTEHKSSPPHEQKTKAALLCSGNERQNGLILNSFHRR